MENNKVPSPSEIQRLGDVITKALFEHMGTDEDAYRALAESGAELVGRFDVARTQLDDAVGRFDTEWDEIPASLRPAAMGFVGAALDAGTDNARDQYSAPFVERFFTEDPTAALDWIRGRGGVFGPSFDEPIRQHLAAQLSGESDDAALIERAAGIAQALDQEIQRDLVSKAARMAAEQARYSRAAHLADEFAALMGQARDPLVEQLLTAGEANTGTDQPDLLVAVSNLDPSLLDEGLRKRQAAVVAEAAVHRHTDWRPAYDRLAANEQDPDRAAQVVSRMFDHVAENGQQIEGYMDETNFLLDEQEKLRPAQLRQLGTLLIGALEQASGQVPPRQVAPLAQALGRFAGIETDERRDWVTKMVLVERQQTAESDKEVILRAAGSLAGRKGSKAREVLNDRLKELKKGMIRRRR